MDLANFSMSNVRDLQDRVREASRDTQSVEEAAQRAVQSLRTGLGDALVLARIYVTVPYGALPALNRAFVDRLAQAKGIGSLLNERTPVLSLMGTAGSEPAWNDRRRSQGHIGIPLAAASFVQEIPMITRLLQDLGLGLGWIDGSDRSTVERMMEGGLSGVFYVPDAATATDARGRKIIPATEFVVGNRVKTVAGTGGVYVGGAVATLILFTRTAFDRATAQRLAPLANVFKAGTIGAVMRGAYFAPGP